MFSFLYSLILIFIFTSQEVSSKSAENLEYFCDQTNNSGNYISNSTYETNLNTLLSTLTSNNEITKGFYNSSYGENTNKVNAIGLCRGDVKPNECRTCLNITRDNLTQLCPNRIEAIAWYKDEKCMLRYSNRSIFGVNEIGPAYYRWNMLNATTKTQEFKEVVKILLENLKNVASSGDSILKYATMNMVGPNNQTIYGLAQCTPDLSKSLCDNCLDESITTIQSDYSSKIGVSIVRPSCNLRYETNSSFYEPMPDSMAPLPSPVPPPPLLTPASFPQSPSSPESKSSRSRNAFPIVPLLLLMLRMKMRKQKQLLAPTSNSCHSS